uniref:Uncharacterized protein n=1 Tax=Candidatus Kentrum sp. SD TaxID=2126332 RepID=A0A450YHL6_9GAMM|nr:MAG: hypothetical protein BECKSD772E_GA0070983_100913 [Candidatus Kentron sp. SD]
MNPALIIFGIQSVVRFGRTTIDASEQWARDAKAVFPTIEPTSFKTIDAVNVFFYKEEYHHLVMGAEARYAQYWDQENDSIKEDPLAVDALLVAMCEIDADGQDALFTQEPRLSGVMIEQWRKQDAPLNPWARVIITAGDIALEYIAINPGILGGDGKGEKLLAAYAGNLSELLPPDGNFGPQHRFGSRLASVFLRAGLQTLSEHPDWVVSEDHLKKLLQNSIGPLLKPISEEGGVFPDSIGQQIRWQAVTDTLMGSVAAAALKTVANHQTAFLGKRFSPDEALGAITRAVFLKAAEDNDVLENQFTKDGLIEIYQAALTVAAKRPDLFLGEAETSAEDLANDLFAKVFSILAASPPPFDKEVGIKLAAIAIETVGANAHNFVDTSKPWEQVAADLIKYLADELAGSLQANGNLKQALQQEHLIDIGRIILERIAATPGIVLGTKNETWKGVVQAIASAMAADERLLLSGNDWKLIASAAAEQAATNPGRLFGLDPDDPDKVLAEDLLKTALKASAKLLGEPQLSKRAVLYGTTLRQSLVILLNHTSGSPDAAAANLQKIDQLITDLHRYVARNSQRHGSKDYLILFEKILISALKGKQLEQLTPTYIDSLLEGAPA